MTTIDTILSNALLGDGRTVDVLLASGKIAGLENAGASSLPEGVPVIDVSGDLLLPSLCDGHLHLDKTLLGLPWIPHAAQPFRMSRIETDYEILPNLPLRTQERAANLIKLCASHGTGYLRSHVDIDTVRKLAPLEGVLDARENCMDFAHVQLVAFPQSGVMRRPGTYELIEAAIEMGADIVGGIDPCEIDRDPTGQLDAIFGIAERRDVGIDIHLHEPGELGLYSLQEICVRTTASGLAGRVTVSHGFCLGGISESKAQAAAELMAKAGVMLATHGAAGLTLPPIDLLRKAGVTVFAGNDDVRDTWSPYGTGDVLERAALIGWKADFRRDDQVMIAYDLVTDAAARALGINNYGIHNGGDANFFTISASSIVEAVASYRRRNLVFWKGKIVARDGMVLDSPERPGR